MGILIGLRDSLSLFVENFQSRGDESCGIGWSDVAMRNYLDEVATVEFLYESSLRAMKIYF